MGVGVRLGRSVGMTTAGGGRMNKNRGAYGVTPDSQQPGSPNSQQPGQNQTAPGQRAQGLKDQEVSLGGGDSRGAPRASGFAKAAAT